MLSSSPMKPEQPPPMPSQRPSSQTLSSPMTEERLQGVRKLAASATRSGAWCSDVWIESLQQCAALIPDLCDEIHRLRQQSNAQLRTPEILPNVTLLKRDAWTSDRHHVQERFQVLGGVVTSECAKSLLVPWAPWCVVAIWDEGLKIFGYEGAVLPSAWPDVFDVEGQVGGQCITLTPTGARLFENARNAAPVTNDGKRL